MDAAELKQILKDHRAWLLCEGGRRAVLRGTDLARADLTWSDLTKAVLYKVDLTGATLTKANLTEADLSGANLSGTNLGGCILHGANLHKAKGIFSFGPIGCTARTGYVVEHPNGPMVKLGCYWGDMPSTLAAVCRKYGPDSAYKAVIIAAARALASTQKQRAA